MEGYHSNCSPWNPLITLYSFLKNDPLFGVQHVSYFNFFIYLLGGFHFDLMLLQETNSSYY